MKESNTNNKAADKQDKFGYASLCVGDSAERFSQHMDEYGDHYGVAARNLAQAWQRDGPADQTLTAAHQLFRSAASVGVPLLAASSFLTAAATSWHSYNVRKQTHQIALLAQAEEQKLEVHRAELLFHATTPESLLAIIQYAYHYGLEETADHAYVVVSDSMQAIKLRHLLQNNPKVINEIVDPNRYMTMHIFDNLQAAFDAIGEPKDSPVKNGRVMIYFHSLVRMEIKYDLFVRCNRGEDCLFVSDAGSFGLEPRLILNGKLHLVGTGSIKIRSVAICGGIHRDDSKSLVKFRHCTCSKNATTFSANPQKDISAHVRRKRKEKAGLLVLAIAIPSIALASAMLFLSGNRMKR